MNMEEFWRGELEYEESLVKGMKDISMKNLKNKTSVQRLITRHEIYQELDWQADRQIQDILESPIFLSPSMFKIAVGLMNDQNEIVVMFEGRYNYIYSMQLIPQNSRVFANVDAFIKIPEEIIDEIAGRCGWLVNVNDLRKIAVAIPADMYSWEYLNNDIYHGENEEVKSHIMSLMAWPRLDGLELALDVNRDAGNILGGITTGTLLPMPELEKWLGIEGDDLESQSEGNAYWTANEPCVAENS